jgi:hypothetical protein
VCHGSAEAVLLRLIKEPTFVPQQIRQIGVDTPGQIPYGLGPLARIDPRRVPTFIMSWDPHRQYNMQFLPARFSGGQLAVCWGKSLVVCFLGALLAACSWPHGTAQAQGILQNLREDVRDPPAGGGGESDPAPATSEHKPGRPTASDPDDHGWGDLLAYPGAVYGAAMMAVAGVTSPIWVPHTLLSDDGATDFYFPVFPYDNAPGYLTSAHLPPETRPWAARLSIEHLEPFDHMDRIGGRLLVSTVTRFGLDSQVDCFRETLPGGRHDQLWTGDCNVVFRFAQSEFAEFRAGLGFNWMADSIRDDFGFNFTYGADFFPGRPWVVSADLDLGTLGHAELFRFRTTIGVTVRRFEFYTGYEYTDIERLHTNSLIGGVRIWF